MADAGTAKAQIKKEEIVFGRKRFEPGIYHLDLKSVLDLPLRLNGQPSTFAEVCRQLWNAKV